MIWLQLCITIRWSSDNLLQLFYGYVKPVSFLWSPWVVCFRKLIIPWITVAELNNQREKLLYPVHYFSFVPVYCSHNKSRNKLGVILWSFCRLFQVRQCSVFNIPIHPSWVFFQTRIPHSEEYSSTVQLMEGSVPTDEICRYPIQSIKALREVFMKLFFNSYSITHCLASHQQEQGFFVLRTDRNKHLSGKKGEGVRFMINDSWCNCNNTQEF